MQADIAELSKPRRFWALVTLLAAFFMDLLDGTILNVAIPSIQGRLHASSTDIQWIVAGYLVAFALLLIPGGRLGDIIGYKKMFVIGMGGFVLTSFLSGISPDAGILIFTRILQGVTAALMVPQILSIIQVMFRPQERAGVIALYGALGGLASAAGPILGALIINANLFDWSWRPIFFVNIPVGLLAIAAGMWLIPSAKSSHPLRVDWIGTLLATLSLFLLVLPLVQGRTWGWPWWSFAMMASSFVTLALFIRYQLYKERKDGSPLVALRLFRFRSFASGLVLNWLFFTITTGFFFTFTIFLQIGLGFSVLQAGISSIPFSIGIGIMAGVAQQLVPKFGRYVLTAGALIMALGFLTLIYTVRHFGSHLTSWDCIPALLVAGAGMGMVVAPVVSFVLADVPRADAGSASGLITTMQQIGSAIGVAVVGVVFFEHDMNLSLGFQQTLAWIVGGLVVVAVMTLLLPRKVESNTEVL